MHYDSSTLIRHRITQRLNHFFVMAFLVIGYLALMAEPALAAAGQSPMGNVICAIVGIIYGNLGRGLAVLAVIIVGVGGTLGKISWGMAITVAVGIATVFGAVPLVAYLISGNASTPICFTVGGVQ